MHFVADRDCYDGAAALIDAHGARALARAADLAATGRARDNPFAYARWCRVGRVILMMQRTESAGTRH